MSGPPVLPLTDPQFRATFGAAFADMGKYTVPQVTMYLTLAAAMLDPNLWADQLNYGIAMFTAHNLVLDGQAFNAAANGQLPGLTPGPIASKSLGPASVSYDTSSGIELDAGHFNLTVFGRRFIHTARLVGMGGAQLGGSTMPGSWFPGSSFEYGGGVN